MKAISAVTRIVLVVAVLVMGSLSCGLKDLFKVKVGGKAPLAAADVKAEVKTSVDAALVRFDKRMENKLSAHFQTSAGRDINMTESFTSILLALGAVLSPMVGLLLYYRAKMNRAEYDADGLVEAMETHRYNRKCKCGEHACLDCLITRISESEGGPKLAKRVARVTKNRRGWKVDNG